MITTAVEVGHRAPDAVFQRAGGGVVRLADFWLVQPTVFIFLRHFG
jgi:hypothetical protein